MTPSSLEFIVVGVVANADNLLPGPYRVLIGRCGDAPIAKGSTFGSVYHYEPRHYPNELGKPPVRDSQKAVRIEVVDIQTMNRSLDLLGQGMTGALIVRGEGLELIEPGWVLGDSIVSQSPVAVSSQSPELTAASS